MVEDNIYNWLGTRATTVVTRGNEPEVLTSDAIETTAEVVSGKNSLKTCVKQTNN